MFLHDNSTFSSKEEKTLKFWNQNRVFQQSVDARKGSPLFSFYDGPPFATGLPHYGHLLAGTIKDVIPRFKTMQGYYVPRRFGWDCHGLPIENEIEKEKNLTGASQIEEFGIAAFNEACRGIVLRYTSEWKISVERMGRWVDFENSYKTMDPPFMESVWWVFSKLYEMGLVYQGYKVMPYSAKLGTPLSNFEANLNYKDVDDPSLVVMFQSEMEPNLYILAWTTTPWTLPSNLALTVHPDYEYVIVERRSDGVKFILAKDRVKIYFPDPDAIEILDTKKGESLVGIHYKPILPYFSAHRERGAFRIVSDTFVTLEDGTGIVHTAPAFGEQDYFVCQKEGIEPVSPVDANGKFTREVPEYQGTFVKDADREIIRRLKEEGKIFSAGQIHHRYPFCWRSDTPLLYMMVKTWFVAVEKIKDKMIQNNQKIHWVPDYIKDGRFGKWLDNARDWAISRNRYWGTPIPIWMTEDGECLVISSIEELEKLSKKKVSDLHRHFIDQITIEKDGKFYRRIPEVFDCWFESGSMPYAQLHYPFENEATFKKSFPADFIAEGIDQTRGWFYTLTVLAAALFDQPAFKNVIVNGIILAEDGNKMSKRLKNYPEPQIVIDRYGADAVRFYLLSSPATNCEDLKFSERGLELVVRQLMIPLWNAYVFLATYAKIYHFKPINLDFANPISEIDRWIISESERLIEDVTKALEDYELWNAALPLERFVDQLTNWYIRRSRARFWSDQDSPDRRDAFTTLYRVLRTFSLVAAPIIPFLAEELFSHLRLSFEPISVHLMKYPVSNAMRDPMLERQMALAQEVASMGHALRKEAKIKVRQPLKEALILSKDPSVLEALITKENLLKEELNVKELIFSPNETEYVHLVVKPNFRTLGKKVGPLMKAVQQKIQALPAEVTDRLETGRDVTIEVEGQTIVLTAEDVAVERIVKEGNLAKTSSGLTLLLNTQLTSELEEEGLAREIVNKINSMRRDLGFDVVDRIHITMETSPKVQACFKKYEDYIMGDVLGKKIAFAACDAEPWDLNGEIAKIQIVQAQ